MNLLMVTHYFDSHGGGIELVAGRMFRGLSRPECRVIWAAANASAAPEPRVHSSSLQLPSWNRVEEATGVPVPVPTWRALKELRSAVREADVVVLHDCLYLSNMAAYLWAHRRGIPVIVIQHIGIVPYRSRLLRGIMGLANRAITSRMLAAAQQVVFISENTKEYFKSVKFSRPPLTIFNGVDCETFRPLRQGEDKKKIRERLGLPQEGPVALFVGRFVPKKGLGILRQMAGREPGVTWAFAGTGPLSPESWGLTNVRIYSSLRDSGLAELYRASDVLVLPSTGEGFPLVLQEALASGLPVLCGADAAGADHVLTAYLRGIELTPGNDSLSAERFLAAAGDVLNAQSPMAAAQRRYEFARSRYSWQAALNRYFELASGLVHAHRTAPSTGSAAQARPAFAAGKATQGRV